LNAIKLNTTQTLYYNTLQ